MWLSHYALSILKCSSYPFWMCRRLVRTYVRTNNAAVASWVFLTVVYRNLDCYLDDDETGPVPNKLVTSFLTVFS